MLRGNPLNGYTPAPSIVIASNLQCRLRGNPLNGNTLAFSTLINGLPRRIKQVRGSQ
jgi:hypothetical protein